MRDRSTAGAALALLLALGASPALGPSPALAQGVALPPPVPLQGALFLTATLGAERAAVASGLVWRVYGTGADGEPALVARSGDAAPTFALPPGEYTVHVAYGLAAATRRVVLGAGPVSERVALAAGALAVRGTVGDQPAPADRLAVQVFIPAAGDSENRLVAPSLRAGDALRLPEGTYHVVSTYGGSNSVVRADIRVAAGKLTEAELHHRAATLTLKLVSRPGGEALANTAWTVLTPGGDVIREAIGAFPQVTLAEGEYTAIARNAGAAFTGEFKVTNGDDRDVEVVAREEAKVKAEGAAAR